MNPPPGEQASLMEDFMDIFTSPSKVFERRAKSGFMLHLLIITVVCAAFLYANRGVMSQIFDAEFSKAMAKQAASGGPQMSADQMAMAKSVNEKIASVGSYFFVPLGILISALVLWITGMITKARTSYGQMAMIVTLAFIPRILGFLVTTLQVVLTDTSNVVNPAQVSLSPARLMNPDTANPKLFNLMLNFDVFAVWAAILIGIGIAVVAKVPRSKGYVTSAIVFILLSLPSLLR